MRGVKVTTEEVDRFIAYLYSIMGWASARKCSNDLGYPEDPDNRMVRALASATGGRVISGNKGYRLKRYATTDEKRAVILRFQSQIARMEQRVREIAASDEVHPDQDEFPFVRTLAPVEDA